MNNEHKANNWMDLVGFTFRSNFVFLHYFRSLDGFSYNYRDNVNHFFSSISNTRGRKMNINDVEKPKERPDSFAGIWRDIFEKQMKLAEKYREIENMGDLLETTADNPDTLKGQRWIKDFAWRVTEELAEAFEAFELGEAAGTGGIGEALADEYLQHFKEELADALHFMVELTIIAGYDYTVVPNVMGSVFKLEDGNPWTTVYNLGLLCNTLKNKPWKQTQMLTDRANFEKYLKSSWLALINLLIYNLIDYNTVWDYYFKKNKVNQFRQRSKY